MKTLTKEILIDAIIGRGIKSSAQASAFDKLGIVGLISRNQWVEEPGFILSALEKLSMDELLVVYKYDDGDKVHQEFGLEDFWSKG